MTKAAHPKTPHGHAVASVIVFGLDRSGKAQGARFARRHPDWWLKAATALDLAVCEVTRPTLLKMRQEVSVGRLYANGRGFRPAHRQDSH